MILGLFSSSVTRGGRFLCTITAVYNDNGGGGESPNNCDCGKRQEVSKHFFNLINLFIN